MINLEIPYCIGPFRDLYIRNEGYVYCCCNANQKPFGNIRESSLEEIWNGPKWVKLRQDILSNNIRHSECKGCDALRNPPVLQGNSLNITTNYRVQVSPELEYKPIELNCGYDMRCNLRCPSCRSDFYHPSPSEILSIESIHEKVKAEVVPYVRTLYVTGGGDPFVSPLYRKWLQTMTPADVPNLKRLTLMTNGQLFTPQMWDSMSKIHSIIKGAIITVAATTKNTFDQIRVGGDWEQLQENLRFIATLPLDVNLVFITQAKNLHEMADFVLFTRKINARWVPNFSCMENWVQPESVYAKEAVHRTSHPRHSEYLRVLQVKDKRLGCIQHSCSIKIL